MSRSLTYAVADLHGRFDLLQNALAAIDAYAGDAATGQVVFLGDYIDRGPASRQIVERLRAGPRGDASWICLKGNHEDMMVRASRDPSSMSAWIGNGGDKTLESYQGSTADRHIDWLEALPRLHIDAHRVFAHAGVDSAVPLDAQPDDVLMWKRYPSGFAEGHGARHVVHGHQPSESGPRLFQGRTALDTLAWRTGRLVVAVFDDALPGGPIDLLEILL